MRIRKAIDDLWIELDVRRLGTDLLAVLHGGAEHVGCVVLALPRPSLANPQLTSCTSSVINRAGHKDEVLCRMVAEQLCIRFETAVVCTGGIHFDEITEQQLCRLRALAESILAEIEAKY
jgi:hypothetical protein